MFSFKGRRQFLSPPLHTHKEPDIDAMFSIIPTAHLNVYASQALNALKGLHFEHFLGVELPLKTTIHRSLLVKQRTWQIYDIP